MPRTPLVRSTCWVKNSQSTVNSRLADTPLLRTLAITDKFQIPGESYRGLTENNSRYYGLSLLRNYGHFCGTNITILLFSLSMKRTLKSSHVTSLRKMAVCSSSFVNAHFKIVWKVYFLVRPVRLLSCRLFGFFTSACAFSFFSFSSRCYVFIRNGN